MKIKNIALALTSILALGFVSCDKGHEYEPSAKETGSQVYFAANLPSSYNLKEAKDNTFSFSVLRSDATSAVTVNLSYSIFVDTVDVTKSGLFTCPEEVSFEAGKKESTVQVKFDLAKLSEGVDYSFKFVIANETTLYGSSSYSFTASLPASWTKWKKVHVTEGWWGEEETEYLYYQDKGDGKYYCYIENCFDTEGGAEPTNFYFTWNLKTNMIDVEKQYMGWEYSAGQPVYFYDWYNYFITDGGYAGSWADADDFYARNGDNYPRSYYDGNGGFYFNLKYYVPGVGGWTPDPFDMVAIAEGFVRTTDYNDDKHVGASLPLYVGNVESMFFSTDVETPVALEGYLRYSEYKEGDETTVYYLKDYFKDGNCLAFTAPVPEKLDSGSVITDVDNEQSTGLFFMGNEIYVTVKTGSFYLNIVDNDTFPAFDITLKVYAESADGLTTYDFGTVNENFEGYKVLKDNYTIEDINGAELSSYIGKWLMISTDFSDGEKYAYYVTFEQVGTDSVMICNLSGLASYFGDTLYAVYDSYGLLELYDQKLGGSYKGDSIYAYVLDPDAGKIFTGVFMYGGICEDGNFAFVNRYSNYNLCGLYYRTFAGSGLTGFYYIYGAKTASSVSRYTNTFCPTLSTAKCSSVNAGAPVLRRPNVNYVEKASANRPVFNLQPIVKGAKSIENPTEMQNVILY